MDNAELCPQPEQSISFARQIVTSNISLDIAYIDCLVLSSPASLTSQPTNRIESLDLLKGLVMVIMALDHTRDFFHQTFILSDLTNPASTTLPVYLTRWITHFCAPAFCFLAGVSAFLIGRRKTKPELSGFLIKRGLWLAVLELTVISFAWYFNFEFKCIDMAVIWSLGISMIFLAGVIYLPKNAILLFSCLLIAGHNLFDNVHFEGNILWSILHEFATFRLTDNLQLNVVYPVVPWIGVMALGYWFGSFYDRSVATEKRKRLFNTVGAAALILFVLIRWTNLYGDPMKWRSYEVTSHTFMSFLNLTKYPPSLLYLLITLGGTFIFLANSENWKGKVADFFSIFGRVPFFYYVIHLYFIHLLGMLAAELTGHGWRLMIQHSFDIDLKDFGFDLWVVYLIWIGIVLMLYPLCKIFDRYKRNHKEKWWLSYL